MTLKQGEHPCSAPVGTEGSLLWQSPDERNDQETRVPSLGWMFRGVEERSQPGEKPKCKEHCRF